MNIWLLKNFPVLAHDIVLLLPGAGTLQLEKPQGNNEGWLSPVEAFVHLTLLQGASYTHYHHPSKPYLLQMCNKSNLANIFNVD